MVVAFFCVYFYFRASILATASLNYWESTVLNMCYYFRLFYYSLHKKSWIIRKQLDKETGITSAESYVVIFLPPKQVVSWQISS
jgi:hypothetical protein